MLRSVRDEIVEAINKLFVFTDNQTGMNYEPKF